MRGAGICLYAYVCDARRRRVIVVFGGKSGDVSGVRRDNDECRARLRHGACASKLGLTHPKVKYFFLNIFQPIHCIII